MPYGEYAKCPCCGKIAYDKDEIEKEFGYRDIGNDKIIPHSKNFKLIGYIYG